MRFSTRTIYALLSALLFLPLGAALAWTWGTRSVASDPDFFYVPGTMGIDPTTGELVDGVQGQFRQAMENVKTTLEADGMSLSRAAAVNVFLSDTRNFSAMNEIYRTYFPTDPPTRATVGADLPLPGALVQVSMVALRPHVPRRVIRPAGLKSPELPYSWGISAGSTLFIAGATSRDPDTYQPVTGDVGRQTQRVFGNIGAVLREAGMDYGDLASCTVFMNDPREFALMNSAYREYVTDAPPARATVRARLVNPAFKVEIQCVAALASDRSVVIAEGASLSTSPFSPAIKVGNRLYLAGMVGSAPAGIVKGEIGDQTTQTLNNLRATLATAGMGFGDVTGVHIFVSHIVHAEAVGSIVDDVVGSGPPRTVIGAELMGPDPLVEIMMVASRAGTE
jgi:enamine deaminase RidA (YjgF/YER057c/UK114 family)